MIRKFRNSLILILTLAMADAIAQNSQVLYYMNIPQNHFLNPALRPSNSVYIGLPGISGVNVNINNNFFNFSDIFEVSKQGESTISIFHPDYDISKFTSKIKDVNNLEPKVAVQLFGLGFSAGRDLYIFLDVNERVETDFVLPGDMLKLAFEGNEQFVGKTIDLSSLRINATWYREAGIGFSKDITQKLRVGVKGKLLFGVANFSLDNRALSVTVADDYTHIVDADLMANISAPVEFSVNEDNIIDDVVFDKERFETNEGKTDYKAIADYLLKTVNPGFSFDIGAEFRLTEKLHLSAAVTDLGFIKWKRDISNIAAESQFEFSGVDFEDVYNGDKTFEEVGEEILDSLRNSLHMTNSAIPYRTNLPLGVSFGASYSPSGSFTLGLLSYTRITGNQFREALTLSANVNLGNALSATMAYTTANYRYDNLGLGLAFRLGFFQIYALADRIPVTWNKILNDGESIPLPESLNTMHARLGMNLVFGNKVRRKNDKPMLIFQ